MDRVSWGNAILVQRDPSSAVRSVFDVFDSGLIFSTPQVVTIAIDIEDETGAPIVTDDRWWAHVEVGIGGARRVISCDLMSGTQLSLAASSLRVSAERVSGANPNQVSRIRASVGVGQRSTSGPAPTWTSLDLVPNGVTQWVSTPKHAHAVRVLPKDNPVASTMVLQDDAFGFYTLTSAELRAMKMSQSAMPVTGHRVGFTGPILADYSDVRLQFLLDL